MPQDWLEELVETATAALEAPGPFPSVDADEDLLVRAWERCGSITAHHSRTFAFASRLLPLRQRRGIWSVYAFCRTTDDIADHGREGAAAHLEHWRREAMQLEPSEEGLVPLAWAWARAEFRIPAFYAEALVEGIAQDLTKTRYPDFDELARYCFAVASTVGLMSMHVTGFSGPEAVPHAIQLGVAMQLTNVLRDVAEDWRMGRVYLPQQELAAYDLSDGDLARGMVDERWVAFMRAQIQRARDLYREGCRGIRYLHPHGRFAVAAAADLYAGILSDIERHGYDVFSRRAHVSHLSKLVRLPGIWARLKLSRGLSAASD